MKPLTWLLIVTTLVALIWYAPKYLAYVDQPVKSDVIVLFIGPDFDVRKKEALQLIDEGYAQHVLIPAYGQVFDAQTVSHVHTPKPLCMGASNYYPSPITYYYPSYFEATHI